MAKISGKLQSKFKMFARRQGLAILVEQQSEIAVRISRPLQIAQLAQNPQCLFKMFATRLCFALDDGDHAQAAVKPPNPPVII